MKKTPCPSLELYYEKPLVYEESVSAAKAFLLAYSDNDYPPADLPEMCIRDRGIGGILRAQAKYILLCKCILIQAFHMVSLLFLLAAEHGEATELPIALDGWEPHQLFHIRWVDQKIHRRVLFHMGRIRCLRQGDRTQLKHIADAQRRRGYAVLCRHSGDLFILERLTVGCLLYTSNPFHRKNTSFIII